MNIKKLFTKKDAKYYTDIDNLPVWNWFKINETDNLTYLLYEQRPVSDRQHDLLRATFEKIYEQFINTFGINEMLRKVTELRRDITVLKLEMAIHNDRSRETFIDMKEAELRKIVEGAEKEVSSNITAYLEKYMGFYIDEKIVTVKKYYSYIERMKEDNEANLRANGRQN